MIRTGVDGTQLSDIWHFSLTDFSWDLLAGKDPLFSIPPGVATTLVGDFLIFFGGYIHLFVFQSDIHI